MKDKIVWILSILIFIFVAAGTYFNIQAQEAVDRSRLPTKVTEFNLFQRWLTNLKNHGVNLNVQDFKLVGKDAIYSSTNLTVASLDDPATAKNFNDMLAGMQGIKKVVFSPDKKQFIDFRNEVRGGYQPNQVHYYGQRDDKLIDTVVLDCSQRANCYFDRGYFLDNDTLIVTEISRNISKRDTTTPLCPIDQTCTYTVKLHLIDLLNNSSLEYDSKPFDIVLSKLIPSL